MFCSLKYRIMSEPLRRIRKHWNSNFKVRLRANAVDPTVRSETGGTIVVSGYLGYSSLRQSKNYEPVKISLSLPCTIVSIAPLPAL